MRAEQALARLRERPSLLTVREVAELLRVSTASVYTLCREGALEHHQVSRLVSGGFAGVLWVVTVLASRLVFWPTVLWVSFAVLIPLWIS